MAVLLGIGPKSTLNPDVEIVSGAAVGRGKPCQREGMLLEGLQWDGH